MNYRAKNIGIAVGLAALAAILTSIYVINYKRNVQHGEGKVTVPNKGFWLSLSKLSALPSAPLTSLTSKF